MKMIKVMSKKLVRNTIDMIQKLADESYEYEDDEEKDENEKDAQIEEKEEKSESEEKKEEDEEDKYEVFWKNYGKNIKLGVIEDSSNRMKLAKLLR
jgi:heat shock protein beta